MVAINESLLRECTGEGCGGDNDICTDSLVHHRNAENRAPVTRNHRSAPLLGRWMEQDPAQFINGANTYQFVNSSPVGNVDAEGTHVTLHGTGIADPSDIALKGAVNISGPQLEPWRGVASYDLSMSFNNVNGKVLIGNDTFHLHALAAGGTRAGGAPSLGRWMEQDPAQYINGANTYQFVNSSPLWVMLGRRSATGSPAPASRRSPPWRSPLGRMRL